MASMVLTMTSGIPDSRRMPLVAFEAIAWGDSVTGVEKLWVDAGAAAASVTPTTTPANTTAFIARMDGIYLLQSSAGILGGQEHPSARSFGIHVVADDPGLCDPRKSGPAG